MILLTPDLRFALRANAIQRHATLGRNRRAAARADTPEPDPMPVLKLFNPLGGAAQGSGDAQHRWNGCGGAATWIATELYDDGDTLFGLADLGFGCPELGVFSLSEIASVRLPFGMRIERDTGFETTHSLSAWAEWSRRAGSILHAETLLRRAAANQLPPAGG